MVETYTLNPNLAKTIAVAEWIQQRIDWQIYQPNQRVPSVRKLASLLNISSFTVVQAYERLAGRTGPIILSRCQGLNPSAPKCINN